jgi:hypothetical protein
MAYLTLINADLSSAQLASLETYIDTQVTAGTTDGIRTSVVRNGAVDGTGQLLTLAQRNWVDSASATACISYVNTLGGTVNYAQVVAPL